MNKSTAKKMKQRSAGKSDIELGKRIRLRRVEQKISQAELGDKLGVSFQQVQKYEKGVNRVGAARLAAIATALDVPVTFFYDGDGKAREVESLLFLDSGRIMLPRRGRGRSMPSDPPARDRRARPHAGPAGIVAACRHRK
jgi:transcriptional regulator with XRE-family HTH domain